MAADATPAAGKKKGGFVSRAFKLAKGAVFSFGLMTAVAFATGGGLNPATIAAIKSGESLFNGMGAVSWEGTATSLNALSTSANWVGSLFGADLGVPQLDIG